MPTEEQIKIVESFVNILHGVANTHKEISEHNIEAYVEILCLTTVGTNKYNQLVEAFYTEHPRESLIIPDHLLNMLDDLLLKLNNKHKDYIALSLFSETINKLSINNDLCNSVNESPL